jgi:hypothetical protein
MAVIISDDAGHLCHLSSPLGGAGAILAVAGAIPAVAGAILAVAVIGPVLVQVTCRLRLTAEARFRGVHGCLGT